MEKKDKKVSDKRDPGTNEFVTTPSIEDINKFEDVLATVGTHGWRHYVILTFAAMGMYGIY